MLEHITTNQTKTQTRLFTCRYGHIYAAAAQLTPTVVRIVATTRSLISTSGIRVDNCPTAHVRKSVVPFVDTASRPSAIQCGKFCNFITNKKTN